MPCASHFYTVARGLQPSTLQLSHLLGSYESSFYLGIYILQIEYFVKMIENNVEAKQEFKCEDCEKVFTRKTTQRDHHARMHRNEHRYSCFVCKKGFYDRTGMRRHLTVHDEAVQNRCSFYKFLWYCNNMLATSGQNLSQNHWLTSLALVGPSPLKEEI